MRKIIKKILAPLVKQIMQEQQKEFEKQSLENLSNLIAKNLNEALRVNNDSCQKSPYSFDN